MFDWGVQTSTREVKDASGAVTVSADYSEMGGLLMTVMLLGLALPMPAIFIARRTFLAVRQ